MVCDPHWDDVVLLVSFDGADASTTFTDESDSSHTLTAADNAQLDTAQKKWGTASLLTDGANDYVYAANSSDWNFGSGDFTVDFQIRFNSLPASGWENYILSHGYDGNEEWGIRLRNTSGTYYLEFQSSTTGTSMNKSNFSSTSWAVSTGTWYHIEICRSSGNMYCFIDGSQHATDTDSSTYYTSTNQLQIGGYNGATTWGHDGWIDELRITKGVARHTASFTAPPAAYGEFCGLTGQESTSAAGTLIPNIRGLTGQESTSSTGTLLEKVIEFLTGSEATSTGGSLGYGTGHKLVGEEITFTGGTLNRAIESRIYESIAAAGTLVAEAVHLIAESMDIADTFSAEIGSLIVETMLHQVVTTRNGNLINIVEETVNALDLLVYATQVLIEETADAADTASRHLSIAKAIAETMAIVDTSSNMGRYYKIVSIAMAIADTLRYAQETTVFEVADIVDTFTTKLSAYPVIEETADAADTASRHLTIYSITEESMSMSDTANITARLNALIQENMAIGLVYEDETEIYSGWVVNPENYAVSQYTNYNFNSLAKLDQEYFAANSDGLFKITGNLDETDYIETKMTLAALDFGSSNLKQVPYLYLGTSHDGTLIIKVAVDGQETVYYSSQTDKPYLDTEEIKLGKGLIGRYWQFTIVSKDATQLDLDTIEFFPVQLGRKRR